MASGHAGWGRLRRAPVPLVLASATACIALMLITQGLQPVSWWRPVIALLLATISGLPRLVGRVRSAQVSDSWREAAFVLCLALLPAGPWVVVTIAAGSWLSATVLRRAQIKAAYNSAVFGLAAAAGLLVSGPLHARHDAVTGAAGVAIGLAAAVFIIVSTVLTAWVVSVVSGDEFRPVIRQLAAKDWGSQASRVCAAMLVLWLASTPRSLAVVPPLLFLMHRLHVSTRALELTRRAYSRLSAQLRGVPTLHEPDAIAHALVDALALFGPDTVEVELAASAGVQTRSWFLPAGGQVGSGEHPQRQRHRETDCIIERPLTGTADELLGYLRLIFRKHVELAATELAVLEPIVTSLASTIVNARAHEAEKASTKEQYRLTRLAEASAEHSRQLAQRMSTQAEEMQQLAAQHEHDATHDELTGLANRRLLLASIDKLLPGLSHEGPCVGLVVVDLRDFDRVNRVLGVAAGDQVLIGVAERLRGLVRSTEVVARLGADEFAVLLGVFNSPDGATGAAAGVVANLREAFDVGGLHIAFDVAAGFACSPWDAASSQQLLRCAKVALQRAKQLSQDGLEVYRPEHDPTGVEQLTLLEDLDAALRSRQLVLHYQPKYELHSGRVVGVEALVRWQHPTRGLLAPNDFMPAAERSGRISDITSQVLDLALAEAAYWASGGTPLPVAVNMSARDLHNTGLPTTIAMLLSVHQVPASQLTLELTETVIVSRLDAAAAVLEELRTLGVKLSCDDFGTGNNSLTRLNQMPLSELKIDRSFVHGMVDDDGKQAIVKAIIDLAGALRLDVVAEGIETAEERMALIGLGCRIGQGYHLSRPIPAVEFRTLIADSLKRSA